MVNVLRLLWLALIGACVRVASVTAICLLFLHLHTNTCLPTCAQAAAGQLGGGLGGNLGKGVKMASDVAEFGATLKMAEGLLKGNTGRKR